MRDSIHELDRLLRGELTRRTELRQGRIEISTNRLVLLSGLLGLVYGASMGLYAALGGRPEAFLQLLATMAKVPLLFLLTLMVTYPSLYVFSALASSRLSMSQTLRLLVAAITVHLAVLASFAPITAFFTLSTDSYAFMKLINVLFFAISGLVGLGFLWKAIRYALSPRQGGGEDRPALPGEVTAAEDERATPAGDGPSILGARNVFRLWILIYGIVGAQMGWILRPFVGDPAAPFELFRDRRSNFFIELLKTLIELMGG